MPIGKQALTKPPGKAPLSDDPPESEFERVRGGMRNVPPSREELSQQPGDDEPSQSGEGPSQPPSRSAKAGKGLSDTTWSDWLSTPRDRKWRAITKEVERVVGVDTISAAAGPRTAATTTSEADEAEATAGTGTLQRVKKKMGDSLAKTTQGLDKMFTKMKLTKG